MQVKDSNGNLLQDEKFTYDVNNNRIGVMLNGTQQLWTVYDGANPYMDFNGSGQLLQRYLTDPRDLNQFYGQVSASGMVQWFLTDNIGSIRQVVDASGNLLYAATYSPFGGILSQTYAANAPRFGYAGGAVDSLSGDYQFDARYYTPVDGRFVSQDPLGFTTGDTDLYRYVFNVPLSMTDPTGLKSEVYDSFCKYSIIVGIAGGVSIIGGLPILPKRVTSAATAGTSIFSRLFGNLCPLPFRVWAPTVGTPWAMTNVGGRVVGRWLPIIGWAAIGYDVLCLYAWAHEDAPPDIPHVHVDGMTTEGRLLGPARP